MNAISVVIPTHNRCLLLKRALGSVCRQKGVSFEVIVIDDGSMDGTVEMISKDFPSVRYVYQKNQGPAAARNRGIEHAQGKWIAFLDSDDEWMPGKLAAQIGFFNANPGCLIHQTEEIWIRNGRRVNPMKKHQKFGGMIFEKCLPLCIVSPSAVMMHRALFDEVGFFDESLPACEDYDLWLRIAAKFPIGLITQPYVIKYGGHPDQRSHEFPAMDRFRIQSLAKILNSGVLSTDQANAARKMLEKKSEIYVAGVLKRAKIEKVERFTLSLRAPAKQRVGSVLLCGGNEESEEISEIASSRPSASPRNDKLHRSSR